MKAVVLAAGEGNRMRPLTYTRPKVMLPIANKPILEHLLTEVSAAGIEEFIFVVGYCDEQVRQYFGDGSKWGVSIGYCNQRKQMGSADAVRSLEGLVEGNFLVLNGDIIVKQEDIRRLAAHHRNTVSIIEVADTRGLGIVQMEEGKVIEIYEKVENPPSRMANAGLYLFTPDIFAAIQKTPKSPRGEYEITDSLRLLMQAGQEIQSNQIRQWLDLSYPWDLLEANERLMTGMEPQVMGELEDYVVIKGSVSIGKNSLVRSGSYIEGPVIIGEDCEIGPGCHIRPCTTIGDGCKIGFAVGIKNSIIMRGSKLPHHNYVGDSVIGADCNFGAGTKVANLRLDKKNVTVGGIDTGRRKLGVIIGDGVETGINSSINVGCVIGNNVHIGPGALVSGNVAPEAKIF
ncbi:MAG: sugar phosphate nucleotidyltransferase [Dehalococcoidales bacterium]|nr:sugar phosphate nucleotidyltransferase [Dehalococcoidales bacterium]